MYQFHSGFSFSNSILAGAALTSGQPVALSSGELVVATDAAAIAGVVTTTVADGKEVGFQAAGFCGTSMIDGSGTAIAVGDELEVASGKFVKKTSGVAVAVAMTAVTTNLSTATAALSLTSAFALPVIRLK